MENAEAIIFRRGTIGCPVCGSQQVLAMGIAALVCCERGRNWVLEGKVVSCELVVRNGRKR